jgi:hypothetical protein
MGARRLDIGGLVFGLVLLFVGGYYLLRNTFGIQMADINWDMVWPILVIVLGGSVLFRAWTSHSGEPRAH